MTAIREDTPANRSIDNLLLKKGILDPEGFESGYAEHAHPVEVHTTSLLAHGAEVPENAVLAGPKLGLSDDQIKALFTDPFLDGDTWRDKAFDGQRRYIREIRRHTNLRTTQGRDQWQRPLMAGDVGTGLTNLVAAYTGTTSTTLTGLSGLPTATSSAGSTGLIGHLVFVPNSTVGNSVTGVIVANTPTTITVDQWYAMPNTGAVGTTPTNGAGTAYVLGMSPMSWVGISTSVSAAAAGDVLRTADGLFGDGTSGGAATEVTGPGLGRAWVAPTFPGAGQFQWVKTWTYTGSSLVTLGKVLLTNSAAVVGGLLGFDTLLSSTGTVNANGDTIAVNPWLFNL